MSSEASVQRNAWAALSRGGSVIYRLNSGKAWLGAGEPGRLRDGSVVLRPPARPIALGFALMDGSTLAGQSDLGGWTTITITPEWVGRRVAVVTFIETKESGGGVKRKAQQEFVDRVQAAGGIAGFAKSPEEAVAIVNDYRMNVGDGKNQPG